MKIMWTFYFYIWCRYLAEFQSTESWMNRVSLSLCPQPPPPSPHHADINLVYSPMSTSYWVGPVWCQCFSLTMTQKKMAFDENRFIFVIMTLPKNPKFCHKRRRWRKLTKIWLLKMRIMKLETYTQWFDIPKFTEDINLYFIFHYSLCQSVSWQHVHILCMKCSSQSVVHKDIGYWSTVQLNSWLQEGSLLQTGHVSAFV